MLGEQFDSCNSFLVTHHFEIEKRDQAEIVLSPESYFSKNLCRLTLGLQKEIVIRTRLKLNRALLQHRTLGAQTRSAAEAFIQEIFPPAIQAEMSSWIGQANPTWLNSSDKIEVKEFSLTSRVSQNWIQLEGLTQHSKDNSWWQKITGRKN